MERAPIRPNPAHREGVDFREPKAEFERKIFELAKRIVDPNLTGADRRRIEKTAGGLIKSQGYVPNTYSTFVDSSLKLIARYVEHVAGFRPLMYQSHVLPINGVEVSQGGYRGSIDSGTPTEAQYRIVGQRHADAPSMSICRSRVIGCTSAATRFTLVIERPCRTDGIEFTWKYRPSVRWSQTPAWAARFSVICLRGDRVGSPGRWPVKKRPSQPRRARPT